MKAGWQTKTLGQVCEFQRGLTYGKGDEVELSNNIVLRAMNIDLTSHLLDFTELKYISDKIVVPGNKKVKKDSLMICTASGSKKHLGKIAYIDDDYGYAFGGFMGMLTPNSGIVPKYLFYLMTSGEYEEFIGALADGMNINNLKFDELKQFRVPFPEPSEQRRIVGILDKAFEGIATAKASAEKNLINARALFASHLQSVFNQRREGWDEATIGQHIRFIDYRGRTPEKTDRGLRLITAKNVKMGFLQDEPREYVALDSYDAWMTRGIPRRGDVLFTTEAPLANVAQLDTDEKVVFAQRIIVLQPDASVMDSAFLKYLLLSQPVQERIRTKGTGATVQGIKARLLKTIEISFPPSLVVQRQIVSKLDALRIETQRLESVYQRKLTAIDALKKSLLNHAFSGEM